MEITIDKVEVLQDVKREAEYIGSKRGDYDKLRAIDADDELLRRWISEACLSIESELRDVGGPGIAAGSVWVLRIHNENGRGTWASATAQSYVESRVLVNWLQMVAPDQAEVYALRAAEKLGELKKLVYYRSRIC